jgi:hypothetical protein
MVHRRIVTGVAAMLALGFAAGPAKAEPPAATPTLGTSSWQAHADIAFPERLGNRRHG